MHRLTFRAYSLLARMRICSIENRFRIKFYSKKHYKKHKQNSLDIFKFFN